MFYSHYTLIATVILATSSSYIQMHVLSAYSMSVHSLAMCSLGWDVLATDLPAVVDSVLLQNIATNLPNLPPGSGTIQVRVLDWNVPPVEWTWEDNKVIASETRNPSESHLCTSEGLAHLTPQFDLVISADTVYSSSLVAPLLRTIDHFSKQTSGEGQTRTLQPAIFICLERRDPIVIEQLLAEAKKTYMVEQIPERVMLQTMEKNGLNWKKDDWDGLEIWSFGSRKENGRDVCNEQTY